MQHLHLFSRSNKIKFNVFMQTDKIVTKLWAVMSIDYYGIIVVWGTAEGSLASRRTDCDPGRFDNLIEQKIKQGYNKVDKNTEIYNKVRKKFDHHLVWETLIGRSTNCSEKLMSTCEG